jgi:hypothetical protein
MAGTLTLTTLSDGTNSTSSTNCILGSSKAWVKFQGGSGNTAGVINGSFNVSSITVIGTGQYTVNLTNAMADANYSISVASSNNGAAYANTGDTNPAAGSFTIWGVSSGSVASTTFIYASIFR